MPTMTEPKSGPPSAAALRSSALSFMQSNASQPQQKLSLVGGVLALVGSFLPFYVINMPAGMGSGGSMSFMNTGLPGFLALLAAIVLSVIGIMPAPSRLLTLLGFGLATLVLGMLLFAFAGSGLEAANPAAAGVFGRGIGFYMLGIGYLLLEYTYVQQVAKLAAGT